MWPAFWMLGTDIKTNPWPACGEIDIVEAKGASPQLAFGTVHGPGYSGGDGIGGLTTLKGFNHSSFNVYAIEWKPDQIRFERDSISAETRATLESMGHRGFREAGFAFGDANSIVIRDETIEATSDPRSVGGAAAW